MACRHKATVGVFLPLAAQDFNISVTMPFVVSAFGATL